MIRRRAAPFSRRFGGAAIFIGIATLSGCMPPVMHGPRVEDGTRLMVAVGATRMFDWEDEPARFVPTAWAGLQRGWTTTGPAIHTGVQLPLVPEAAVLVAATTVDVYLQPTGTTGAGFGLLASFIQLAPYAQLELVETSEGTQVYTTQAVLWTYADGSDRDLYWFPSIAAERARGDGSRNVTVQLSGGIGIGDARPAWSAAISFIVGFKLAGGG